MMYRSQTPRDEWHPHIGPNIDWSEREAFRPDNARLMLRTLLDNARHNGIAATDLKLLLKYGSAALLGGRANSLRARLALYRLRAVVWLNLKNREKAFAAYRKHWKAATHYGNTRYIAYYLANFPAPTWDTSYRYELAQMDDGQVIGFYPPQTEDGKAFRRTRHAAMLNVTVPPATYSVTITLLPTARRETVKRARFYLDGHPVQQVGVEDSVECNCVILHVDKGMFTRTTHFLSIFAPGLPVVSVEFAPAVVR
jgi:hypothetical protein